MIKTKKFFSIFLCLSEIYLNFEHFQTKKRPSQAMYFPNYRLQMSENSRLRGPFHKQHGKRAQTLLQPRGWQLYNIYSSV